MSALLALVYSLTGAAGGGLFVGFLTLIGVTVSPWWVLPATGAFIGVAFAIALAGAIR